MRYYLLTIFFLYASIINSQNSGDYPLEIPIILSGTFGELRPNHFHAGIDIKTKGTEGFKVYSIGDGYVSKSKLLMADMEKHYTSNMTMVNLRFMHTFKSFRLKLKKL